MSWAALSLKNLTNALIKIDDWEGLGVQLDIDYHELQKLIREHPKIEERKLAMLQFWLDRDKTACWEMLISALNSMNLKRVAEEIKKEYQIMFNTPFKASIKATPAKSDILITTDLPLTPPSDLSNQTRKVRQEISTLECMYDELVAKAGVFLSKRQAVSPEFLFEFRFSVAVLPTSLKHQHKHFLEHHSSQIAKASTVEEIFSILNSYWDFLNCSLLGHIIHKFGDEELQKQLSTYTDALQSFRSRTRITDFMKVYTSNPNLPPEFVDLKMKIGSEWEQCTLEDTEKYRNSIAQSLSLAKYALYLKEGVPGSIYLVWSVPNHAICCLVAAMNSKFIQDHCIENVTIDGEDLEEYKHRHNIDCLHFTVISQHVDELSEGLVWTSREGCLDDVVFLLSTGVDSNSKGQDGWTALMWASLRGHTDVVQKLLSSGAQVDHQDEYGWTALMRASDSGYTDVVQELLSGGAQIDLQDEFGETALMWASAEGQADVVRELLSGGALVDLQNKEGKTALMWASAEDHTVVVQRLLSGGAQTDLQDEDGWTALMWACDSGHTDVVQELIAGGAKVDLQTEDGQTALILAVQCGGNIEIVKVLLAAGADVNHQEKTSGRSALFYGAQENDLEIIKLLIQGGANLSLKDKDGVTADELAEVHGHQEVCAELRKQMHGGHRPLSKAICDRVLATGQLQMTLYKRIDLLDTEKTVGEKDLGS